ncbi:MAG TPA: S8 family serine peptidase [Blastocatellia bacterium]|nr:S8 family serine peptidase [Blastocatellia bacterium]
MDPNGSRRKTPKQKSHSLRQFKQPIVVGTLIFILTFGQMSAFAYALGNAPAIRTLGNYLTSLFSSGTGTSSPKLSASALQQINDLIQEKMSRTAAERKISSKLLYQVRVHAGERVSNVFQRLRSNVAPDRFGNITVDIRLNTVQNIGVLKRLDALGASITSHLGKSVLAEVSIDKLSQIASYPEVVSIRPPDKFATHRSYKPNLSGPGSLNSLIAPSLKPGFAGRAQQFYSSLRTSLNSLPPSSSPMALNVSQGDITHRAQEARNFFGTTGAGVKIGVLSDGVDSLAALQASGDLPSVVTVLAGQAGFGDEGSAMLEIVHDLAPGAQLFFATAGGSPAQFAQNIRDLATAGCRVIVDDVVYFVESPFQDGQAPAVTSPTNGGIIAQAVRDVTAAGVLYFSSAGNEGNLDDGTSGTWEGDFNPNGTVAILGSGAGVAHNFGDGGQSNRVTSSGELTLLDWSDPLGASGNDYDVYILDNALTTVFDASTDVQDGNDDPIEIAGPSFTNERLVVVQFAGANRYIRLEEFLGTTEQATSGATFGHSAVANAFAVAAVDVATASGGTTAFVGGATNPVENFSADGPRRLFYNPDSSEITPGNVSSTGGLLRQKPDIAAADGVAVATPGFNPFFGTSAAAPHAAAIAGLLLSSNFALTPAQVRTGLTSSALDIEAAGVDRDSGAGIVMAFQALQAVGATPKAFLQLGNVTFTDLCNGNGTIDPCESVSLSLPLTNVGGAGATAISGVLTSASPGVTIVTGTAAYPNLAPSATGTSTPPFKFKYACGATCGAALNFTLTVTYSGGPSPQVFTFSLKTGAAGAPVTVSYTGPVVPIPDATDLSGSNPGAPAFANLTVSGLTGSIFDIDFRFDGTSCSATPGSTTVGLDHTFINDLQVTLISPAGTQVKLIDNTDGSGNNFCQTTLDDESAGPSIQSVASSQAPFTGSFKPANPLSAFDGETPNGTWQLKVQDFFAEDTGNIRAFSLVITPAQCTAVQLADLCVQDDSVAGKTATIDSTTGAYQITCGGSTFTGTGVVVKKGSIVTITDNTPSRRVLIRIDLSTKKATATVQSPPGNLTCTITDSNIMNNSCDCTT